MELAVASENLIDGARAIEEHWARELTPEQRAASEITIDLDAETATCPACMSTFAPGVPHCPGCGLRVG